MAEAKGITVDVLMNTDKLQRKLKAIAKHAEALANELDAIDKAIVCPNCGSADVCQMHTNGELTHASCNDCEYTIYDDLPTRLEGSE
jgi:transposase-like protein